MAREKKEAPSEFRKVPAVSRAIAILEYLAGANEPLGVVPLARHIGLIPSTCLHILRVLTEDGLVMSNPRTKQYSIGAGVLSLARAYARQDPFIQVTQERLVELSHRHGVSFAAIERSGPEECIVVAIGDAPGGMSVRVSIGARFPLLVSSTGICFAAFGSLPEDALKTGFSRLEWASPFDWDAWIREIDETRIRGYSIDDGHFIIGTCIISVPVMQDERSLLGCLAVVGLKDRLGPNAIQAVVADMQQVARESHAAHIGSKTLPGMTAAKPSRSRLKRAG